MPTPADRIQRYLNMRNLKPLPQLGDIIHGIHFGTEYEAELTRGDVEELWRQHQSLLSALEEIVSAVEREAKVEGVRGIACDCLPKAHAAIRKAKGE